MLKYLLLFCISVAVLYSQEDSTYLKPSSFEGLHFYAGYIENEFQTLDPMLGKELKLFIATKEESNINVKFPGEPAPFEYNIPGDSVVVIPVSQSLEHVESEKKENKLIEITSDVPITVYGFSSQKHTSDSYSAIPVANWGKEYYVMSMPNDRYSINKPPATRQDSIRDLTPRQSEFLIMAAYDNTTVSFTPTALTHKGKQAGRTYTITLDEGESYMVQSYPLGRGMGDLSGTKVTSDKPIGLISGHQRTSIPIGLNTGLDSKDHLIEMLMPAESWGRKYVSVPFGVTPVGDYFKISGKEEDTFVAKESSSGNESYDLNTTNFIKVIQKQKEPALWTSNKPVQIAQFMMRTNQEITSDQYDPCMVMLPPVEQYVSRVIFHTPGVFYNPEQYDAHYVTIIVNEDALSNIKLNGELLDTTTSINSKEIGESGLYWEKIKLSKGTHLLSTEAGKFSGVLFGHGKYDSYAMVLGASLTNPTYDDSLSPSLNFEKECFTVTGSIADDKGQQNSGIAYAFIRDDKTRNFDVEIDKIEPNDTEINFSAEPADIFKNGQFTIDYYDKSGNFGSFTYKHDSVNIDVPGQITHNSLDWKDSTCFNYDITNLGLDSLELLEVSLTQTDDRIKLYTSEPTPKYINSNGSFPFKLCFAPNGDSSFIKTSINVVFECGIEFEIPVEGGISAPDFLTEGHDFGKLLVGENICDVYKLINIGNVPVRIDSLRVTGDAAQFIIDYSKLPDTIAPKDTLDVPVCFNPSEKDQFSIEIYAYNNKNLSNKAIFTGQGIAPDVESFVVDFGKRRIGTTNDTSKTIKNEGNSDILLNFELFTQNTHNNSIADSLRNIKNLPLSPGETSDMEFIFEPVDTGKYQFAAKIRTSWDLHPPLTFEVKGIGTVPVVNTYNVDFGTRQLYTETTNVFDLVSSNGNEKLHIQKADVLSGDPANFDLDLNSFNDLRIDQGDTFKLPVTYKPKTQGGHKLVLGLLNDAYPNYRYN